MLSDDAEDATSAPEVKDEQDAVKPESNTTLPQNTGLYMLFKNMT